MRGLLLGCRGALGCWSAICRRPRSRSPAVACRGTSRSRWPSGTACRGSRRGRSSLWETREVRGQGWHLAQWWTGASPLHPTIILFLFYHNVSISSANSAVQLYTLVVHYYYQLLLPMILQQVKVSQSANGRSEQMFFQCKRSKCPVLLLCECPWGKTSRSSGLPNPRFCSWRFLSRWLTGNH